jgi:hypothetical protein
MLATSYDFIDKHNHVLASDGRFRLDKQTTISYDTDRVAYAINILTLPGRYQFSKATFARLILDYNTFNSRLRSQALIGWTPSPGTAFYAGYNDDLNYDRQPSPVHERDRSGLSAQLARGLH